MTTKINLSNIDNEQDYSSLATTLFAKANVAANIANTALATASTILKVTSIVYPGNDTAADTAGGQTITLTGTGFVSGASVLINGSAVGVVSVANSTTLTFTSPSANSGSYVIYVVNPDGGTAISIPGIQYSGTPTWTTAAGSLGSLYETAAFGNTVIATGDTVTYSLQSGTLPPGATFSSNGTITGTSSTLSSPTTYTFTVRATDAQNQDTDRSFSITINPDAVTWSSPTTNTSYTLTPNTAMSNVTLSASSAAGANIFYSANTLPTGVSLTGNTIFGTPTVSSETSTSLVTATANTTSESSSIILNWTVSVVTEPLFKYNSLLLSGDGTNNTTTKNFLDGSTNNYVVSPNGNVAQGTFSPYGANWSNYFDGSSAKLTFPSSAAMNLDGQFTIECWVYWNGTSVYYQNFIGSNDTFTSNASFFRVWGSGIAGGFSTKVGIGNPTHDGTSSVYSTNSLTTNAWNHVAATRDSSNIIRVFINGNLEKTGSTDSSTYNFGQGGTCIGDSPWDGSQGWYSGYISNLRVIKGTCLYTSNFTPSTTSLTAIAGTSLLTCQSNRFKDNSNNAFTLTVSGTPSVQRFSPFSPTSAYSTSTIGGSVYFDGTEDLLVTTMPALSTGSCTIEFWFYPTNPTRAHLILDKGFRDNNFSLNSDYLNTGVFYLKFGILSHTFSFTPPIANQWNHIVICRNTSSLRFFLNGVQLGTTETNGGNITTGTLYIGGASTSGSGYETTMGYISNLRITTTAVYTSNFTPPTEPVTAISNTQLLCNFTNAGIIDNTMINNFETVGDAKISTTQSKFGGSSLYFDGTGDRLVSAPSIVNTLGADNFTIEFWLYPSNTSSAYRALVSSENYPATTGGWSLYQNGTGIEFWLSPGGSVTLNATSAITAGTWQHVALCRASGTLRLFINGTSLASVSNSTSLTGQKIWIGDNNSSGGGSYVYNGYIDDLRITKGYALYTSNFTPPTTAHVKL